MLTEILIIACLLLVNGFFAMSEIAVVSARKPILRQMAKDGTRAAAKALQLAENPGRFLSTVQVGITLVGILAGAYGGATIAQKLAPNFNTIDWIAPNGETFAVILVVTLITYCSVVIGELVPKQFALRNPEKLALIVAPVMTLISRIFTPVVFILEMSGNIVMHILGIAGQSENAVTEAEVKAILDQGVESGAIEQAENDVMQRVIRLGDRDVKSIMTHRNAIKFIDLKDSLETIHAQIHEAGHTHYPVTDGDPNTVIGIVRAKDMLDDALSHTELHLRDYMREIHTIPDSMPCLTLLDLFKKSKLHMAVVVDEYGSTEGLVTTSDMLEAIIGMLPSNYYEGEQAMILRRDNGSWLVEGRTPLDEIHLTIGLDQIKANPAYETIAGFILHHMARKPKEADSFEAFDHRFEVVDMDGNRIDKIIITPNKQN